ncbi:Uncharacterised protein [[Clostridium] sordellii]|uniref:hypothetical protein n=1 Tax=Paraclostridium sordellii TaxID=1505 RepID=UPI0005DCDD90|nr:hypothetical protein [Paeniclostridium sordellii]CEP50294.1 Uncharacterised protein [[Clostridium] sordellii] [Paeniclostridium sordellii]
MYEVGDKVEYKNCIFIMKAEILEIFKNPEDDYKYYIAYEDYEGEEHECLVREVDLVGFSKGTKKHLKQELNKLIKEYSREEILEIL